MHIHLIIKKYKNNIEAYSINKLLYSDIKIDTDIHTTYVLCISTTIYKFQISLTRILAERASSASVIDWATFETYLPEAQWVFFETHIPVPYAMFKIDSNNNTSLVKHDYPTASTKSVKFFSTPYNDKLFLEYGSLTNNIINEPTLHWMLPDIIVTDQGSSIQLNNSIPIVNNNTCIPTIVDNQMYIENSMRWLSNTKTTNHMVSFIDFSPLGNIEIIKFKDSTIIKENTRLNLTIPDTTTLTGKSIIIVMANRILLDQQYTVVNDKNILLYTYDLGVNKFIVKNMIKANGNIFNTPTYYNLGLQNYITNYVGSDIDTENFIIIIDNPNINYVSYDVKLTLGRQGLLYDSILSGLLYNTDTCEIEEGTLVVGDDTTMLTRTPQPIIETIENLMNDTSITYVHSNMSSFINQNNKTNDNYNLIDIVSV